MFTAIRYLFVKSEQARSACDICSHYDALSPQLVVAIAALKICPAPRVQCEDLHDAHECMAAACSVLQMLQQNNL